MATRDAIKEARASEAKLQDFLSFLADYVPTLPDELVDYYAASAGLQCSEVSVRRLMAVATQKFVADIAADAFRFCRMRQSSKTLRKAMLTNDDLAMALKEYGIELKRPEYFAESPAAGSAAAAAAAAAAAPAPPAAPALPPTKD